MLAQAIAKELDVSFINIGLDSIQDKWYGETTKLVKAMFTLAKKIKPCVIFIDEIDSVLGNRSSEDHEATKGECRRILFLKFKIIYTLRSLSFCLLNRMQIHIPTAMGRFVLERRRWHSHNWCN